MAAATLLAPTAAAAATTSAVILTVHVGYHDTLKLGDWMPVTVDITNNGPDLDGVLEVQSAGSLGNGGPPGGVVVYQTPVSLGAGATKHIRTYVQIDQPGALTAQLVRQGRVVASQQGNASNTTGVLIGVLSDQPATLNALAATNPGGISSSVVHLAAEDLSDTGLVLRPFDLLAIDDFATDTLTAAQRAALVDYVVNGGSLLLGTGGAWHKTLGGLPEVIVPVRVSGSTTLGPVEALGGTSGVEVATGTVAGATAWLAAGGKPLLVEQAVGAGTVELATFDWNQAPVAGWAGTTSLLREVLIRSSFSAGTSTAFWSGPGPYGASIANKGSTLAQVLVSLPALDLPAWWIIGSLVLVYVLLVGPINYFVLRALKRRALAWITVPTIALVAAGGAYGGSLLTKGTSVQTNQISIIHVAQGSERAYQEAYTGVFTPTRGDYDVGLAAGRPLISAINYYNGGLDPSQGLVRVDTTNNAITLPGMTAFTLRGFATEGVTSAPRLVAHVKLVGGKLTGTIQNLSSTTFTDAIVLAGGAYQTFGELRPGASVNFSLTPSVGNPLTGPPSYMQAYPSLMYGNAPAADMSASEQREAAAKSSILSTLPISGFKGISLSVVPTIVAWSHQSFQDLTVNGSRPRSFAETGVVITAPVEEIAAGSLPVGVITGRLVDIEGDAQQQGGLPGVVVLSKGSVTYNFTPTLASGAHLSGVSITSSNPFGAKGVLANGSETTSAPSAEVWDWGRSTWTSVTYVESGATVIPDAGVNPSTGEVRLKLSSNTAFGSGWLSLSADVK